MKHGFALLFAALAIALTLTSAPASAAPVAPHVATAATLPASIMAVQFDVQPPVLVGVGLLAVMVYLCFFPNAVLRIARLAIFEHGLLIQRVNRSDPEKIFITVYNSYSTAALSNGQGVIWDFATDADGLGVTRPTARATNAGMAAAGVVAEAIAAGAYGLVQVYGYHSAARVRTVTGGSPAIVPGRPLVINVAGSVFCLESVSTASNTVLTFPMGFSLGSTAGFTTIAKPIFVKAL